MAISLSKLKPTEMVRLMNSTDYGTVLSSTQIYRHFEQGGYRISSREDSRCLNFYSYLAWLVDRHNTPPEEAQGYARIVEVWELILTVLRQERAKAERPQEQQELFNE